MPVCRPNEYQAESLKNIRESSWPACLLLTSNLKKRKFQVKYKDVLSEQCTFIAGIITITQ